MDIAPRPARRRARWIVLGVLGFILLSLGGIFLDVWIGAGKTIERERKSVAERIDTWRRQRVSIPNLFEPVEEGNAYEPLVDSIRELDSFSGTELDVFPSIAGDEFPYRYDDEAIALMLVRLDPTLDHLRRAGRRREVEMKEPLKNLLQNHEATSSDLRWFGGVLDRLEENVPPLSVLLHRDDLAMRQFVLRSARENKVPEIRGLFGPLDRKGFRKHLPVRIQVAHWFGWKDGIEKAVDHIERLAPWERPEAANQAYEAAGDEPLAMMTVVPRVFRNWLLDFRDMTLARLAVALAAYGAEKGVYPAALEELTPHFITRVQVDPWNGKPFRYLNRGDSALLYSFGCDGDDDGGRPVEEDSDVGADGDVVWTIKRREAVKK